MEGHDQTQQGSRIDNLPEPHHGILTGNYEIDYYGCWWEIAPDDKSEPFWMIGAYPA